MFEVVYSEEQIKGDIMLLKYLVKKNQVTLRNGTGLKKLIEDCEKLISLTTFTQEQLKPISVLFTLVNSLRTLWFEDIDFKIQLGAMNTGNYEYGNPDPDRDHYFKDFEFEVFSGAQLIGKGVKINIPQHTEGEDLEFGDIDIQCKHPSTVNQVKDLMNDFTTRLNDSDRYGIFGMAVEDCFGYAQRTIFKDDVDYESYMSAKLAANDKNLEDLFSSTLARCTRILGLYTTSSFFIHINGKGLRMVRLSNSVVCFRSDRSEIKDKHYKQAFKVINAFNPHPTWLTIKDQTIVSIN